MNQNEVIALKIAWGLAQSSPLPFISTGDFRTGFWNHSHTSGSLDVRTLHLGHVCACDQLYFMCSAPRRQFEGSMPCENVCGLLLGLLFSFVWLFRTPSSLLCCHCRLQCHLKVWPTLPVPVQRVLHSDFIFKLGATLKEILTCVVQSQVHGWIGFL